MIFMIGYKNTIMIGEFLALEAPNKKRSGAKPSKMINCRYLQLRPKRFYYGVICPEIT
jgi:hypothetical protein